MKKILLIMVLAATCFGRSFATADHLLPKVQSYSVLDGSGFNLARDIKLTDQTNTEILAEALREKGANLVQDAEAKVNVKIVGDIAGAFDHDLPDFPNESYTLTINDNEINITAVTPMGVKRAAQTLAQLAIGTDVLECADILDWPAFKLRGYMHDVGRSFISVDELKKEIRLLAAFKVNTFHWHFTENQAWRFQVKSHPELTQAQYMTRFAGDFYTQEQIADVIAEADKYGVIIIPELDMPGHSEAFQRATGVTMQSTQGMNILKEALNELVALFKSSPYIHIGGDETTISNTSFVSTMVSHLHGLNKKVVCWNPMSGLPIKNYGFDMTQMWSSSGQKVDGIPNIDCRYNYVNHFDVFADLVGIYKSQIYYADRGTREVAGSITAVWNDRKMPDQEHIVNQNNFYANTLATCERAWIGGGEQYIEKGGTILPNTGKEFDEFADWERRFLLHKDLSLAGEKIPYVKQTNVRWNITQGFNNNGNYNQSFIPETDLNSTQITSTTVTGAGIYLRHTWGAMIPTLYKGAGYNQTAYAYTYVYSPTARRVGALIEFQNYGRSEADKAPEAGCWDRKGSKVWLNDTPIAPPTWSNTGRITTINTVQSREIDLLNENFAAREPIAVDLVKGWNKVLIKLPYVNISSEVRLNKWMFTFVFTELDGRHAVSDLLYSPTKSLDAGAESLIALIAQARAAVSAVIGDEVGYYASSELDRDLLALAAEYEETLTEVMSAEQRSQQVAKLQALLDEFNAGYADKGIVQPDGYTYYNLFTPDRENRYVHSTTMQLTSVASPSEASAWLFRLRGDGSYDIINHQTKYYISQSVVSSAKPQLTLTTAAPQDGWYVKASDTPGRTIIVSGTSQMNMTNSGLQNVVYNWGDGVNIQDGGCKYKFIPTQYQEERPDGITDVEIDNEASIENGYYNLNGQRVSAPDRGIYIVNGEKKLIK